jgi:TP901 family phage tail tape measure protein
MSIDLDIHGNTKPLEASVQAAINRIRRQPIKITVDDKGATQPLGNMKRGADEFSKSMEAANARIIAFGASMAIINGVSDAFKGMVKNMIEVEKAMADINVVMGLSAKNLDKFSDGLFKVAKETGAAFNVAAQAATEYARQGLAVEESLKRTKDALILTRLTGMDSANAVKSLTAAMNTYGDQIKDTTQLVSKFAAVDVQFAVSAEDFADAIARTGAAAKGAGVDIDELIGLVTAAQQQTARGGKVIGNSLKTIFTRVGRTDTLNQLENLGIAVRDFEGKTLGAKRILTDLANTFDALSESQKAQIAQTVGGVFQINVLKAVLGDAAKQNGILSSATQIAAGATDEAIQKNEQLRNTMSAMASETGNAIKQVSAQIGEIMLAPGMEKILNTVKSFAETASGVLGDGESTGSKFASGFLRGLGNIITGPGLVVMTTVFVKLFAQAFKFTKESLNSLIGITTQAQKQKAIQTSLVSLVSQNAQLSKEILRTDVSRTQKEQMILGLIQAQVSEARVLNEVTRQSAASLYKQGYGPSLTKGRGKAEGHIPNFSERQQAAQGGYAAGNIRSMDMPGQGSVIYNSAEKVKNFKGMRQPAIMPPQSSKAGENYQQAFGDVHGFDPYAAGGYIPNFNKSKSKSKEKAGPPINLNSLFRSQIGSMGVLLGFGSEGPAKGQEYSQTYNSLPPNAKAMLKKKNIVDRGTSQVVAKLPTKSVYEITETDVGKIEKVLGESQLEKKLYDYIGPGFDQFSQAIGMDMFGGRIGKAGINVLKTHMEGSVLGGLFESAVRGSLDNKKVEDSQAPFDFTGSNAENVAEFMGNKNLGLIEAKYNLSAAKGGGIPKKVLNYIYKNSKGSTKVSHTSDLITKKGEDIYVGAEKFDNRNKDQINRLEEAELPTTWQKLNKLFNASGFIPNFADPLSDAIGRERSAGVPVSQIRIGTHGALMNRSNPIGLGVTNTHDEPNGLKDVFGANGFVPNYAFGGIKDVFSGLTGETSLDDYRNQIEKSRAEMAKHDEKIKHLSREHQKHIHASQDSTKTTHQKNQSLRKAKAAEDRLTVEKQKRATAEASASKATRQGRGASIRGNAGLTAVLGLPMAASYLQEGGPGQTGSAGNSYVMGGALQGAASTGYMASMIAPFFGPAAPFVVAAGALYGAFDGYNSAIEENTKALKEKEDQISQSNAQKLSQDLGSQLSKSVFASTALPSGVKMTDYANIQDKMDKLQVFSSNLQQAPDFKELSNIITTGSVLGSFVDNASFLTNKIFADPVTQLFGGFDYSSKYKSNYADSLRGNEFTGELALAQQSNRDRENIISSNLPIVKNTITDAMKSLGDKEIYVSRIERDKDTGKNKLSDQKYNISADKYLKLLEENKILDSPKLIAQLGLDLSNIYEQELKASKEKVQGVITELNKQKAQRAIKSKIFDAEMQIKRDTLIRADLYSAESELQKQFLSEKRQSEIKYNKALNQAADALASGKNAAESDFKQNVMDLALKDPTFRNQLAQNLPGVETSLGKDSTQSDITGALIDVNYEKLREQVDIYKGKLSEVKESEEGVSDAKQAQIDYMKEFVAQYDEGISKLKETHNLTKLGLDLHKTTNAILDERKRIQQENTDELRRFNEEADRTKRMQGYDRDIAQSAIQSSGMHVTREQKALMGVAYAEKDVSSFKSGLEAKRIEELNKLNLSEGNKDLYASGAMTLEEINRKQKQDTFDASGANQELQKYEEKILYQSGPRKEPLPADQALDKNELKEYESILAKKELINTENDKEKENLEEIKGKLEAITEEEGKGVEAIRARARARLDEIRNMKGPGAMGAGFKRGIDKMNEQVTFMDYELGQRIPENLANGLADAMGSALDGTKKLDDALMDVAYNFLGMIQQAFLQKAAYQIVGAIGGGMNTGGGVRNYSSGGTVPAMVSDGEYLMNRDAVNKYGGSFMHNLNNGSLPKKYHAGGSVGDFFEPNQTKQASVGDFFSSPSQGFRSSRNNAASIRRAINENPSSRTDFSSAIKGPGKFSGESSPASSDITNALKGGYEAGQNFFGDIATGLGDIFSMVTSPFKAVGSFLGIPGFSQGGDVNEAEAPKVEPGSALNSKFGGGRGIESGRLYQKKKMSSFFYSQSGNVGLSEDKGEMVGVLRDEERARQEAEARRKAKKARRKALLARVVGTVISYGLSEGLSSMAESGALGEGAMMDSWAKSSGIDTSAASALKDANPGMSWTKALGQTQKFPNDLDYGINLGDSFADPTKKHVSRGGKINGYSFGGYPSLRPGLRPDIIDAQISRNDEVQKKNAGGWISGKSGIDQIPAMLSNGEYVVKASSARKIGKSNLDKINAGRYNEGGPVDGGYSGSMFDESDGSSSSNTNNINITINVEDGKVKEEDSSSKKNDPASDSSKQKQSQELAERVKNQILSVIVEEQRPGGLLDSAES